MGSRIRSRAGELDFWPVVADAFLGVLAVVVIIYLAYKPPNQELEKWISDVRYQCREDSAAGYISRYIIDDTKVRIIYSADGLSFEPCQWSLPEAKVAMVRRHLRWFSGHVDRLVLVRIEGHADSRSAEGCETLGPYWDNLQLSQNRARAVFNAVLGLGPTDARGLQELLDEPRNPPPEGLEYLREFYKEGKLLVAGYGAVQPLTENPEDPINRRVEVVIEFERQRGAENTTMP
jgi:flagellar motor protein MotB